MAPTREALVAHRDDRRFRELYRYFQPANPAALLYQLHNDPSNPTIPAVDPPGVIPTVEDNVGNPLAVSLMPPQEDLASPNTILTSFAQLAAHKLNVERAMIWCVLPLFFIIGKPI
jgi:hypothetical protein